MNMLRNLAAASALAVAAGFGAIGTAAAAPAGIAYVSPPAAAPGEAATPVKHWKRRCWPVHRWVWTHWGWRYRYVGTRCAPRHHGPYGY